MLTVVIFWAIKLMGNKHKNKNNNFLANIISLQYRICLRCCKHSNSSSR
jgi:hypothetical protein